MSTAVNYSKPSLRLHRLTYKELDKQPTSWLLIYNFKLRSVFSYGRLAWNIFHHVTVNFNLRPWPSKFI